MPRSLESESVKFAWSMGFTEERVIRETEILFAGTGDRNHCHNGDTGSQFSKKEIKMSDEEIMARAAQLGMVMQETETTEQGDTEQDPDGTDTGAKTEVVTEQTASELLEERTAAEETAQNTEAAAEDVAAEAQENSANTDEETQAQQEAADAENPSGVYRLVIQKGDVCRIVCEKLAENGVISDAETFRQYLSQIGYASNMRVGNYDIPYGLSNEEIAKILQAGPLEE